MIKSHSSLKRDSLLAAVERVREVALAGAEKAEQHRTLALPVVEALRASGLFVLAAPRSLGGAESDPVTQLEVFEAMSRIDTAAGWCLMIGAMTCALAGGYLPDKGVEQVFAGRVPTFAGLQQPVGIARRVPGGYIANGRWPFGSGIRHAEWVMSGAVVEPEAGAPSGLPEMVSLVVPIREVHIEDTWNTSGLRGSGSEHYRLEGVFVPEERTCSFPCAAPQRGGPQFTLPFVAFLTPAHVGFALGAARRALDEIAQVAPLRVKAWPRIPVGSHAAFHMDLGRAEAKLGAARAYAFEVIGAMWEKARAGRPISLEDWSPIRMVATYVTDVAAEVIGFAFRSGGGSALYASSPLQRYFRDIHAATQHIAASDDAYEFAGRVRLGMAEPHPLLAPRIGVSGRDFSMASPVQPSTS